MGRFERSALKNKRQDLLRHRRARGKSNLDLVKIRDFDLGQKDGAAIEDHGEDCQPGLIIVLRTIVAQDGEGKVAFKQFERPNVPKSAIKSSTLSIRWARARRKSSSPAVGGEPARASMREMTTSRVENAS